MAYQKSSLEHLYHTSKWSKLRDYVVARDEGTCRRCHKIILGKFICHHTELANEDNFFDEDIVELLCFDCHQHVTFSEDMKRTAKKMPNGLPNKTFDLIDFS